MQVSISLGIAHKNLSNTVLSHTFDSVASRALIYIKANGGFQDRGFDGVGT